MQFNIKRTVLVYFYLLTMQVACFPGMLNEKDDIATKLQCWISNNVDELLQIEKLNSEEFGLFRTQIGHAIIFEDFKQYSLGSNVMTFINKKVSLKYIMNLRFQQSVNIDHSLQEGLNFVYIKTKLNFQQDGIILHIFNIYQQGQLKQIIQETNNGIVYSFSFHEQQDYYVQIIFATLIQNKFNTNYADIVPFIKSLQKDYQVCSILECKQDIYLPQTLNLTNINQLEPKYIKQAYFRTSQSIQYYDMINSIYFGQINVEDDKILNRVEFSVDCIQLMQNQQERDGITLEWNQYFCINNLVYHFKIKKIQNQKHSKNYFLLFQVNHDINPQELLLQLFNLLDNLKCLQGDHISHNLQKLKEKNSSFIQQFQTSEKLMEDENLELQVEMRTEDQKMEVPINSFQEEIIFIQNEEIIRPQNKLSTLLTEQDSHAETIDFLEMPQFYGQISLVQQNIQEQLSEDDIFSQPLQVEEALHQKRLNQIEQEEKKTQEIQEAITFEQNQQQQQKQQNEDIVFDEYNQDQLERQRISPDINKIENQVENQRYQQNNQPQESNHQHHHHHHQEKYDETNDYESYELHRTHNHHHHHHKNHHHHHEQQEFSENDYSNNEYDNPIDVDYLEYQHHHHRKHHHKYYQQEDQNILSNQSRYNLRGSQQNKYQDEEPEVVDKIVIEYNFQQREVQKENDQPKNPKEKDDSIKDSQKEKTQKVENQQLKNSDQDKSKSNEAKQTQASKSSANQQRQQVEEASSQDKNKQKDKQKMEDKQNSEDKQKSVQKENDRNSDSGQNKNGEEIEDEETQKNKEHQQNVKNQQKQKTQKEKEDKQKEQDKDQDKIKEKEKEKEKENQEQQEEVQQSNKNKNKDKTNKNKNKEQEDNQNEGQQENQENEDNKQEDQEDQNNQENQENQENEENKQEDQDNQEKQENEENKQEDQENQESNQDEAEKQDDQEENKDKPKQKDNDKSDKEKAKQKKKEDCKKNKNKKKEEEEEEQEKDAQQDEDKQQEEKNEEVEEQAEDIYDDYGRYKPNDPFYEHRHSKRGRVPFNYPTRDPYQDMFEDEMFWRYNMMKRQQARFPFNGYPYRHRGRSIDHSPFPHVNSYYKQHPFQKQTYNIKPLFGRDFYPEAGYGMSRVIDAYKGRYTDPEQVLREISTRHQQEKMWRDSLRQYREAVGYSRGPSEYFDDYVPWQYEVPQGSRETFQPRDQFSPYEFNKEIQEETYDYLNDPQYKFRQGKRELVKNFSKPNNKANYDSYEPRDCFVIYDQCNFEGNRLDLCGEYPDIPQYLNNFKVFSFIVPDNLKIKLFQSTKFQDGLQDVEGTQECLEIPYELVPAQ